MRNSQRAAKGPKIQRVLMNRACTVVSLLALVLPVTTLAFSGGPAILRARLTPALKSVKSASHLRGTSFVSWHGMGCNLGRNGRVVAPIVVVRMQGDDFSKGKVCNFAMPICMHALFACLCFQIARGLWEMAGHVFCLFSSFYRSYPTLRLQTG